MMGMDPMAQTLGSSKTWKGGGTAAHRDEHNLIKDSIFKLAKNDK